MDEDGEEKARQRGHQAEVEGRPAYGMDVHIRETSYRRHR